MKKTLKKLVVGLGFTALLIACKSEGKRSFSFNPRADATKKEAIINSNKDTVLTFESGTSVKIGAETFERKDGELTQGKVKITLKEYHSYSEIIASGAPMFFEENDGRVGQMMSAGMFTLIAQDESGAELEVVEGKSIGVDLNCQAHFKGFELFYLEEEKSPTKNHASLLQIQTNITEGNIGRSRWTRIEKVEIKQDSKIYLYSNQSVTEKTLAKPVTPLKAEDVKEAFNVNIDTKKFPEFTAFKHLLWTFASDTIDKSVFKEKWSKMDLEDSGLGYYTMVLTKDKETLKIAVVPVLEGNEFKKAMSLFKENQASYQNKISLEKNLVNARANAEKYIASFNIKRTGTFNIDAIRHFVPNLVPFTPQFTGGGKDLVVKKLQLIASFDGAKSVVTYTPEILGEFFYIPNFKNALLVQDQNGEFYAIDNKEFEEQKLSKDKPKIDLKKVSTSISTLPELEAMLNELNVNAM